MLVTNAAYRNLFVTLWPNNEFQKTLVKRHANRANWSRSVLIRDNMNGTILTATQMREAEALAIANGVSVDVLMERAGAAVAETIWRFGGGCETLILCGPGNNGGDGYVAARRLRAQGLGVRIAASDEPRTEVAQRARAGWSGPVERFDETTAPAPVLVDALFGIGLSRRLEEAIATPLKRLANQAKFRIAVDVPSGIGADDGAMLGAVSMDLTLALGRLKPGHLLQPAAGLCGTVHVADIGVAAASPVQVILRPLLPFPRSDDHKYRRGMVLIAAGEMPGAAMLAARAAQRAGAGYVILASDNNQSPSLAIVRRAFDVALVDPRASAVVIGPGLGQSPQARAQIVATIASNIPLVIDADGLSLLHLTSLASRRAPLILTPHEGEFERLFGTVQGSKIDRALDAAQRSGATIILKGADSVVASPDGRVGVNPVASPWLASAGTGDVLAGIAGAMLGRGLPAFEAACAAVWLHSDAARRAGPALIADDLPDHIGASLAMCG
jgi:ADP-dependent NAD(P)H-hydrate dehydratase / NAD(P)H-hydrate epimerase